MHVAVLEERRLGLVAEVSWQRKEDIPEKASAISMCSLTFLCSRHIGPVLGGKVRLRWVVLGQI